MIAPVHHSSLHVRSTDGLSVRTTRVVGWGGMIAAVALPVVVWSDAIAIVASDFAWDLDYLLTGWLGYGLIAAAVLFMLPVVLSIGRDPAGRFYPRSRNALVGWSVSLYVLGLGIAAQVAQIATGWSG
jgi:hypothetical protein